MPQTSKRQSSFTSSTDTVSVAEAKANFSAIIKTVQKKHGAVTVLRRGMPVAQIIPMSTPQPVSGYGWMRGTVQELGDIVGPTGVEWTAGDE